MSDSATHKLIDYLYDMKTLKCFFFFFILLSFFFPLQLECSAVARIFQSPMKGPPLNLKNHTPQQQVALLSSVQQLHVEVWTASVEGPSVRIEIIDVIARVSMVGVVIIRR